MFIDEIKKNEIMFFLDFNKTLVDYEDPKGFYDALGDNFSITKIQQLRSRMFNALQYFEQKTGFTPVICVVTNASSNYNDGFENYGIFYYLKESFFENFEKYKDASDEKLASIYNHSCNRFFRYLVYNDNESFYRINPIATDMSEMYFQIPFSDEAKKINYCEQFRKKENIERILTMVDISKSDAKHIIFAGDSIKDDYPMKEIVGPSGFAKTFIRLGNQKRFTPYLKDEFCKAKFAEMTYLNVKTGRRIKHLYDENVIYLSEDDKKILEDFASGDQIILTGKNSSGLISAFYKIADMINEKNSKNGLNFGE